MTFVEVFQLSQKRLMHELGFELRRNGYSNIKRGKKFLYAEGNTPVMLVAHLDTVHTESPTEIFFDANQRVYWSPQGIGADDRAGVWAILQLLSFRPYILFTCDEEIGCVGAKQAALKLNAPPVKYIIEFDRQGKDDMVFYDCDSPDFTSYVGGFGFKEAFGSFSDISKLCPTWKIAGVNISCGYYNAHSKAEYLRIDELQANIAKVRSMLKVVETAPTFEFIESKFMYSGYAGTNEDWWNHYNNGLKKYLKFYCYYCGATQDSTEESVEQGMCKKCYTDIVAYELDREERESRRAKLIRNCEKCGNEISETNYTNWCDDCWDNNKEGN